jgi:class 3 adenylate cyclase/pimeloyl-ACP methyl ester carboxylesterase
VDEAAKCAVNGMDISAWLRGLGLERYEQAFRENAIDEAILPKLTAEDLRDLGVTAVGHRRILLDATAALRADTFGGTMKNSGELDRVGDKASAAERRQLTVMFADLVGSTALSARLDPEELRDIIGAYHRRCADVITRSGGFVAKYLGDGVLAYFGWPRAHEDAADRAVRASLNMVKAVASLKIPVGQPLAVRVGIATGVVVVGDLLGEGAAREQAVIGDVPNVAARLQQLAEPGTVVIAETTRRLLAAGFDLKDLGPSSLRGFADPIRAWLVTGEGNLRARFEVRQTAGLTPLVGREHEVALLLARWNLAREGEGHVVLLAGEPGVGKSRIVSALLEQLGDDTHIPLLYQCSPQHVGSALHPVIVRLEYAAGFQREDSGEVRLDKLENLLEREGGDSAASLPIIAALLGIATNGRYPPLALTPQQRKETTLEALLEYLGEATTRKPVLLIFEDLHWIDPSSLEFLELLVDRVSSLPMLVILTARPEFTLPWNSRAPTMVLTISRLTRYEAAALAERISGKTMPPEVLSQIVDRTDGVPLFVEELTRTMVESGLLKDAGHQYALRGPLPPLAIPATLQDSLMARLDRLAEIKEVAQVAACLGREFTHEMLDALALWDENRLGAALDQLADSDLILRHRDPPSATYSFRHALVQEAAYQSLLKSKRQELHAHIAKTVETSFLEMTESQPEWIAHHYMEAGMTESAAEHWLRAAQHAKDAYANREAIAHLRTCLEMIDARSGDDSSAASVVDYKLQAWALLGDLASLAGDLAQANQHYEEALALAHTSDDRARIENKRHRPRTAERDGAKIAFYEHGAGPQTLVFVAPLAYGLAVFQPIVERLGQEFRIVTVDARGVGASDPLIRPYPLSEHVKDVRAVIEALGCRPVVGIGLSRGSNLLLKLAHAEPRLIAKLITIGGLPGLLGPPLLSDEYLSLHNSLVEKGDLEGIVRAHTSFVFSELATRELRELFIQNRLKLPRETMLSFFDPDPTVDVTPILGEVTLPVLVTHGREDRLIKFEAAELITALLPDARLYAFEGKGHLPLFTAPDEFCEVVRQFVHTGIVP